MFVCVDVMCVLVLVFLFRCVVCDGFDLMCCVSGCGLVLCCGMLLCVVCLVCCVVFCIGVCCVRCCVYVVWFRLGCCCCLYFALWVVLLRCVLV